ncbi:MAG: DUF4350 domain-containing protein [Nitrososphaerota archaeon]
MNSRGIAAGIAVAIVAIMLVVYFVPPVDEFQPANPFWNGLSKFYSLSSAKVDDTSLPSNGLGQVLFIIAPSTPFTQIQASYIKQFVSSGGTLVLADNFGTGNSLLKLIGIESRFSGKLLDDALFNQGIPELPYAFLSNSKDTIALNYATSLNISDAAAIILASSSPFSYLLANSSSASITYGPFPVAAKIPYGSGYIILVSDPSIFTNSMINKGSNLQFIMSLIGSSSIVYFDTSHLVYGPLDAAKEIELHAYSMLSQFDIRYAVFLLASAFIARQIIYSRNEGKKEDNAVDKLLKEHPEWDRLTLKRLDEEIRKE